MFSAGIAKKMDEEVMYNKNGEVTSDKEKMYGRPTKYKMFHPEYLLFVNETGCNTNQKDNGHVSVELFVLPTKERGEGGVSGALTDIHFSILCFSSALGYPVMAAVILKWAKNIDGIPIPWKMGIDITKDIENGTTNDELFKKNYGEGKLMPGGPTCWFNGKDIPCFVGCSPKSCIAPEILRALLEVLDEYEVFDRSTGLQPVLLLDGHQSRMKLHFLLFINANHLWTVYLGVPYGTHIWQVGDAPQLNGCFKMAPAKAKRKYLIFRVTDN
jgi:hypothetical protein